MANDSNGGAIQRQDFGSTQTQAIVETASSAIAAQAKAAVEARYIMAMRKPRNFDDARAALLKECRRPYFAQVAKYHKPIGQGIEGPSIRFAEAAIRCMTNIYPEVSTIYDDREKRIVRVAVTDLECNVTYHKDIVVEKTVERSKADGREIIGERLNKQNKRVFIVLATEDEMLNKENALVSKALRTCALRLIPGDLIDEAMFTVEETMRAADRADPDASKKKLLDAFDAIGIKPSQVADYLGHGTDAIQPAETTALRKIYAAIKDGESTWSEVMEARDAAKTEKPADPANEQRLAIIKRLNATRVALPKLIESALVSLRLEPNAKLEPMTLDQLIAIEEAVAAKKESK